MTAAPDPREAAERVEKWLEQWRPDRHQTYSLASADLQALIAAARATDPAAGGDLAAVRRTIHDEVMTAIKAKAGTVLAPAVVVDAAVDAAARMAAGADDSDFTDALARAYDHGRRDASPAGPAADGDLAALREFVAGELNELVASFARNAMGRVLDEIDRRLATPAAPASEAATEGEDVERVLVGELSAAFEAGRRWVAGGAAWDTQQHAQRITARLAATPREQGTAEAATEGEERCRRIGGLGRPDPDGTEDSWPDTVDALAESAHGLIANVDGPAQGWTQSHAWVEAADRWCARYDRVFAVTPRAEGEAAAGELADQLRAIIDGITRQVRDDQLSIALANLAHLRRRVVAVRSPAPEVVSGAEAAALPVGAQLVDLAGARRKLAEIGRMLDQLAAAKPTRRES